MQNETGLVLAPPQVGSAEQRSKVHEQHEHSEQVRVSKFRLQFADSRVFMGVMSESDPMQSSLPAALIEDLSKISWEKPWVCFCLDEPDRGGDLEQELQKEVNFSHLLYPYRQTVRAIAKREDTDDVLFWVPASDDMFAIVQLTWKQAEETDPALPQSAWYFSLEEFAEREMNASSSKDE